MPSELRRGVVRISSSYGRLGLSLLMGIVQTRILLGWLGAEGFGLVAFVGSSVGLALLIDDVLRASMIRELAAAHHADPDGKKGTFSTVLACGSVLSATGTVATGLLFVVLAALVPVFDVPESLQRAAVWLILAEGVHACMMVFTAPIYNMFVVTERFVEDNLFTTLRKASYLVSAWLLQSVMDVTDPAEGVKWYGVMSVGANVAVLGAASLWIMGKDRRLRPGIRGASREGVLAFLGTFGWNTAMMTAVNCYDRVGQVITNLAYGTVGNAVFGVGYQLAAYVRMVSLGVNFGSDAVAARLSSSDAEDRRRAMIQFTTTMTRLHGFTAFPAAAMLWCLTGPVMRLWVGDRLGDEASLASATVMAQILLLPVTVRAVTDCWTRILYGAGYIRRYAPLILAGGAVNPIAAVVLLLSLHEPARFYSAAISFACVFTVFHLFLLPARAASCLGCRYRTLLLPMIRPAVAAVMPVPVLTHGLEPALELTGGRLAASLALVAGVYGAMYFALALVFVLKPEERRRFTGIISRRLGSSGP
ncbi:MAG: hypothetical protein KF787_03065 [Phycisphaeraceae bacterium]|nr:hypothetical protein [Phycisphaerae bacterium]MBX3391608.1 hypothetical protein [Phycisphaeraceae bacterium]